MDDPPTVSVGHCLADVEKDSQEFLQVLCGIFTTRQSTIQSLTANQLHDQVWAVIKQCAEIVDRDNARMMKSTGDFGFIAKSPDQVRLVEMSPMQHLDCNVTIQVQIDPFVDGAASAIPDHSTGPIPFTRKPESCRRLRQFHRRTIRRNVLLEIDPRPFVHRLFRRAVTA